jgi:hypothetical protein
MSVKMGGDGKCVDAVTALVEPRRVVVESRRSMHKTSGDLTLLVSPHLELVQVSRASNTRNV